MKYIVNFGNSSVTFDLEDIIRDIFIGSEIYEVSDKEVYLGSISKKGLVYICKKMIEYVIGVYTETFTNEKISSNTIYCLELCEKWLNDSSSVSDQEVKIARKNNLQDFSLKKEGGIYFISQAVDDLLEMFEVFDEDYCFEMACDNLDIAMKYNFTYDYAESKIIKDFKIKKGEIIIEFLKSDKYLFIG